MHKGKLLVVEDDADLREAVVDTLELAGYDVVDSDCGESAIVALAQESFDMVVSDVNMPGIDGHQLLEHVVTKYPGLSFLMVTAYGSITNAVDAMRQGASDYLVKPFEPSKLVGLVERYIAGVSTDRSDEPIVESDKGKQAFALAKRVAVTDSTVLIAGESGSGKEVVAKYIHQHSQRADKPFIAINCAAIPETMLEATLFGHEKGAFTGAHASAPGKFEQANGGTLLLDEISEMAIDLQSKLLRVLQEQEVERVGGRKVIKLDVRVIATTNRNMREYISEGRFREDLYYRLNVFPLTLAPLRERVEDIVPLSEKLFKKHASKMNRSDMQLSESAKHMLKTYAWPGNVRELENVVQRALILQPGSVVEAADLCIDAFDIADNFCPDKSISDIETTGSALFDSGISSISGRLGDDLQMKEFEMILAVLREFKGRKNKAAEKLGISPRTLRYKLAKMRDNGIDVEREIEVA